MTPHEVCHFTVLVDPDTFAVKCVDAPGDIVVDVGETATEMDLVFERFDGAPEARPAINRKTDTGTKIFFKGQFSVPDELWVVGCSAATISRATRLFIARHSPYRRVMKSRLMMGIPGETNRRNSVLRDDGSVDV
jgi:hypothetical protein